MKHRSHSRARCGVHYFEFVKMEKGVYRDLTQAKFSFRGFMALPNRQYETAIFVCKYCGKVIRV